MVICLTKYLLSDKHQLSRIWLAAHWEKKIKKTQIFEVDIERSIQDIMEAEIILDLRISGHLLVGIVKIHSRKSKYLLTECSSIFYQIKLFRTVGIDLPDHKQTAPVNDITLDAFFDNFTVENDLMDALLTNQSHIEDITLKETNERLTLLDDTDMMDFVFYEEEQPMENFEEDLMSLNESLENPEVFKVLLKKSEISVNKQVQKPRYLNITDEGKLDTIHNCNDKDEFDVDIFNSQTAEIEISENIEFSVNSDTNHCQVDNSDTSSTHFNYKTLDNLDLEPLRISTKSIAKNRKSRKRKLSVDYIKSMSYDVIKKHVLNTSDITSILELTPASKRLMILKENGHAENLLCLPAIKLPNSKLLKLYHRNLKTCQSDNFELLSEGKEEEGSFCMPRKKSKSDSLKEGIVTENLSENLDVTSLSDNINCTNVSENLIPALHDDLMVDTEFGNIASDSFCESRIHNDFAQDTTFNDGIGIPANDNDANDVQSTPLSKTSVERWQYAFQGRIIQMLQCLKLLFQEKSAICFSSLSQNDTKLKVAQNFFCLLMLKKFEVICLEQSGAFNEVFISPDLNFDSAYLKFCCS